MQKKLEYLLIGMIILAFVPSVFAGQYSSAWQAYLADHSQDRTVGAIITMADQVDLRSLQDQLYAQHADRQAWHEAVVRALQEKATSTQGDILATLAEMESRGEVDSYKGLWVGNVILVHATPAAIDQLASRNDVMQVSPNYEIQNIEPVSKSDDQPTLTSVESGLRAIHADQCWAIGITGEGRLVSHLDTGVDGNHTALASRWKGLDAGYDPAWAWFDPVTNTDFPFDSGAHGTHTMGTICGRSESGPDTVGVAFGAQWISAGVIDRVSIQQTVEDALAAFQWITDPDGNPGTVSDVPDCNSNSWGVMTGHGYPPCDETFWTVLDGCEAAGVVVVFAAGNEGPGGNSLRRPADRASTETMSFSIGAVDGNDESLPIADFSSRGPSYCTPDGSEAIKPEVSAPGVNVRSCAPGGGYQYMSGTSMATPHVAGVIALIRQANPSLTSEQVKQIMMETAMDEGAPGEDNNYGFGVVDAYAAVQRAFAYLQGWGTLSGLITDQASGNPISGARITIQNRNPQLSTTSRGDGTYYLFAPADTSWHIKVEHPPTHLPVFDDVTVVENDTIFRNYALEGKVTVTLTASFGNPVDVSYRSFFLKGSWNSDGFYDAAWSAPQIEVKDDGASPDQVAGDGIFTGSVMLARDLSHTYSWAIYTESYGGENARLQNGANFQILTLNPPNVPTLSVNPSGSYHNWIFSAVGNNGLNLDLLRNVPGHPTQWANSCSLFTANTYTLRFRVMHSTVASYGSGGVGGADIVFHPDIDGYYDFKFDDRNDQYIIQLSGTEGPPTYLGARGGMDGHVPVSWLPPGTVESQEIAYDDGVLANSYYYYAYDAIMAEMFEANSYPVTIDSALVHVITEGDQYWPWPDPVNDPIGISIFLDDDADGMPDADPVFYGEMACVPGDWVRLDVPEIEANGPFWIGFNNLAQYSYEGMGLDAVTDYPGNKWSKFNGVWGLEMNYEGDHMVRAKVFGGNTSEWMGYNPTPAGQVSPNVPVHTMAGTTTGTGHANEAMKATGNAQIDRTSYHPKGYPTVPPVSITDVAYLEGYRLYEDSSPAPWDRRPATRVNGPAIPGDLILETSYDVWRNYAGDSLDNGTLYYFQASAVYNVGTNQHVEVGPSNEGSATPLNHPPAAPVNLVGSSTGHQVNLSWDLNTDYDIYQYKIFRKDYGSNTWNQVGTVTHPTHAYSENVVNDGIYGYKVAATDDENMQSASFSNTVYIPIGAIPPRDMRASTNLEFAINTRWSPPGTGGGGGSVLIVAADNASILPGELLGYGDIEVVDYFDARNGSPTLEELSNYSVVLAWSNYVPGDPTGLGDVLADYVDNGGSVIMFMFGFASGWGIQGRIMTDYLPVTTGACMYQTTNLGDFDPSDPIMEGITDVGEFYEGNVAVQNNGTLIASWQNGAPFVVRNPDVNVIALNAYVGDDRQFTGQMIDVVHNAINSAGGVTIEPNNYKLYKASAEGGPFNLLATLPGTQTSYLDQPVPNAVPYWYRVTAVYNGPVESAPTPAAQGMGENHPPEAPANLAGIVDGRNINLTWTFTNQMGDFHHYNIYKKQVPGGTWALAGTSTTPSFTVNIPVGQDGVWACAVSAVDNGSPQLEGAFSNTVFMPVGNLPPNNLRAVSNQESVIPLSWGQPGLLPDTLIQYDDGVVANAWYFYAYDAMMANQFVAQPGVQLDTIVIHTLTEGDQYWPWPDGSPDPIMVHVFDDDGSGFPGAEVFSQEATGELGGNVVVGIDGGLILNGPNFWIAMSNMEGGGEEGLGLDLNTDYPQYWWWYLGGWNNSVYYTGDQMIRASIQAQGRRLSLESNKTPTMELALAAEGNGDNPRPLDTEVMLGYSIYRSTTSPVPIDAQHKIRNYDVQGLERSFNDGSVTNGVQYFYKVTAVYNNNNVIEESPGSNEANATARMGGRFVIEPLSFDLYAPNHDILTAPMSVSNPGGLPIDFSIVAQVQNSRVLADHRNMRGAYATGIHENSPVYNKGHEAPSPVNPPVTLGSGGPDAFGYTWIDSDEPGGPASTWIDNRGQGEQIPLSGDDMNLGPYDLGFDFPWYGSTYNQFYACSNGWISFTSTYASYWNQPLPDPNQPENMLAIFWDDLCFYYGGEVWLTTDGSTAVISFFDLYRLAGDGPVSFQAVLHSNGQIDYNYLSFNAVTNDCTVGWQNSDGSDGWTIVYGADYLHDGLSIVIKAGWLSVDPSGGNVQPNGNTIVNVIADASDLEQNQIFQGSLTCTAYDMNHQVGTIIVPVVLHTSEQQGGGNCQYRAGDINGNGTPNGLDVVYGVNYFKGGAVPPIECSGGSNPPCPQQTAPFYAAGDVNGSCVFNGIDITFFVRFLKGQVPNLLYCPQCPPPPAAGPAVMPIMNNQIKSQSAQ